MTDDTKAVIRIGYMIDKLLVQAKMAGYGIKLTEMNDIGVLEIHSADYVATVYLAEMPR